MLGLRCMSACVMTDFPEEMPNITVHHHHHHLKAQDDRMWGLHLRGKGSFLMDYDQVLSFIKSCLATRMRPDQEKESRQFIGRSLGNAQEPHWRILKDRNQSQAVIFGSFAVPMTHSGGGFGPGTCLPSMSLKTETFWSWHPALFLIYKSKLSLGEEMRGFPPLSGGRLSERVSFELPPHFISCAMERRQWLTRLTHVRRTGGLRRHPPKMSLGCMPLIGVTF